jgi:hypothetical protein
MKVFRVIYFAKGLKRGSTVVAKSKEQAENWFLKTLIGKIITN